MILLIVYVVFNMSLLITFFIIFNSVCLLNGELRIVGGYLANSGQFPYQVSIQLNHDFGRSHTCGGSIIDLNHILTAAHCVENAKRSDILIWAGGVDLKSKGEFRDVKSITIHENWNSRTMDYDIAILKLSRPFEGSKFIAPISLRKLKVEENSKCIVSGWGSKYSGGPAEMKLRFTDVQIINHFLCNTSYQAISSITNNMICASTPNKDACQGDSGGPLVLNNTLVGIVSFGYDCARPGYPGVYTNISNFINWIQQHSLASCNSIQDIQIIAMIIATTLYSIFFR